MKYLKLSTLFTAFALFLIGCNKNDVVPVAGVSLAPESLTIGLSEDNLGKFDLIFTPKNASNKNVTWSSSNPEVASVSPDGIIKGLKQGADCDNRNHRRWRIYCFQYSECYG